MRANPNFAVTVQRKIEEFAAEKPPVSWAGEMYKRIFGVEMPSIDQQPEYEQNSETLKLFENLDVQIVTDIINIDIIPSVNLTANIKGNKMTRQAFVDITLRRFKPPAWLGPIGIIARINFFRVEKAFRGKGECSLLFGLLIKYLADNGVNVISLVVESSTPEKACKCYIKAAAENNFYSVDPTIGDKCRNRFELIFTKKRSPYGTFFIDGKLLSAVEEFPLLPDLFGNYKTLNH